MKLTKWEGRPRLCLIGRAPSKTSNSPDCTWGTPFLTKAPLGQLIYVCSHKMYILKSDLDMIKRKLSTKMHFFCVNLGFRGRG